MYLWIITDICNHKLSLKDLIQVINVFWHFGTLYFITQGGNTAIGNFSSKNRAPMTMRNIKAKSITQIQPKFTDYHIKYPYYNELSLFFFFWSSNKYCKKSGSDSCN